MNAVMISLFLSFGVGKLVHAESLVKELTANIKVHSQEIAIEDHQLSSKIFRSINQQSKRFDQLEGVYKLGKFAYCRTVLSQMRCYLYLSLDLNGSLSSPWVDPDFGKGDAIDYIDSKAKNLKASYLLEKNYLLIWFHGKGAKKIFEKIPAAHSIYDQNNGEIRKGEHIVCAHSTDFSCFLKVPLNHIDKKEEEPQIKWDLY